MAPCSAPASKLENGAARARPRRPRAARNRSTRCRRPRSRRHLVAPVRAHREVARVRFDMMISRGDRDDGTGVPAPDHCERHVEREPGATRPWLAKHVVRVQSDACWSSPPGATADTRKPSSIPMASIVCPGHHDMKCGNIRTPETAGSFGHQPGSQQVMPPGLSSAARRQR